VKISKKVFFGRGYLFDSHYIYFDGAPLDHLGDRRSVGKKV